MENRMNTESNDPESEEAGALVDELRRQTAADDAAAAMLLYHARENAHWFENYATRSYVDAGEPYEDYAPAYRYGVVWYQSNPERRFDDCEADLASGWNSARGGSALDWLKAKPAVREAWYRVSDLEAQAKSERAQVLATSPAAHTPGDH
jgi:hypothetical protein